MATTTLPTNESALSDALRRLIAVRGGVIVLLGLLVALAGPVLGIGLPQPPLWVILGLLAALSLHAAWRLRAPATVNTDDLFRHLLLDLAGLSALLYFSGGATNPLISLLLPPIAVAALTLDRRPVAIVAGLAIAAYSALLYVYQPLIVNDPQRATRLHLIGMWLTFVVSAGMIAWLIMRLNARLRQRDAELAAAREQALRDEHILALGTLAAGAAHELGTPLATMAVITGELRHDPALDPEQQADLKLLQTQITACKDILTGLSQRAGIERLENMASIRVDRWLEALRQRWHARQPQPATRLTLLGTAPAPAVANDPRLEQAIHNLLANAARVTPEDGTIDLAVDWSATMIFIAVRDHGPGFTDALLATAGNSPQPAHAEGEGIGLMLTRSAIEQMGGRLRLVNHVDGGALAEICLPRHR